MKKDLFILVLIVTQFFFLSYSMDSSDSSSDSNKSTESTSKTSSKLAQFIKLLSNYNKTKKAMELNELINVYYELNTDDQKEALLQAKKIGVVIPGLMTEDEDSDNDNEDDDDNTDEDTTSKSDSEDEDFYLSDEDPLDLFFFDSKKTTQKEEKKEVGADKKADELEDLLFQISLVEKENQEIMNQISILQELDKETTKPDDKKIEEENMQLENEKKAIKEEIEKIKNSIVIKSRKKESEGRLVLFYKAQILALKKEIEELISKKKNLENK